MQEQLGLSGILAELNPRHRIPHEQVLTSLQLLVRGRDPSSGHNPTPDDNVTIPARRWKPRDVAAGETIPATNIYGEQVVDTWEFNRDDMTEFMSMEHSRATLQRLDSRASAMRCSTNHDGRS